MRTILIAGQGATVAKAVINTTEHKKMDPKIQESVCLDPAIGIRNNVLNVINTSLKGMLAQKNTGTLSPEPVIFHTVSRVVDFIHNGTPLYWMANGGKQLDGTDVNAQELELWREFYQLYSQLVGNVAFKDLKSIPQVNVNTYRNSRFTITAETKLVSETVSKLWELVKATADQTGYMTDMSDADVI